VGPSAARTSLAPVTPDARPAPPGPACRLPEHLADNPCPRCGADMLWTKASWHCLRCRYKEGCC